MFDSVVIAIVCLPAILTIVWFFEVLAGCWALRVKRSSPVAATGTPCHRTTVLVPAHDEGAGMLPPSGTSNPNSDPTTASSSSQIIALTTLPRLPRQQVSK